MEPFQFEDAGDSPGFLLWQLTNLWQQLMRATLRPFGITHIQFVLLASIAWLEKSDVVISQVVLARHAHTDIMMTSTVLRALEEKGLLRRESHPNDTRARRVLLTATGRKMVEQTVPAVETADARFFGELGDDVASLTRAMRMLVQINAEERVEARKAR